MPAEKIIKEEENNNLTSSEENIQEEKDIEQFLQQIDNIVNVSPKTNTQQKQSDVEKNTNIPSNQNSTNNSSTNSNSELKVRIVKKNDLDGDVNASLRTAVFGSSEVRVVEKNNLETDVIATLRDKTVDYKIEEESKVTEVRKNEAPVIIKPNMTISSAIVEEGSVAIFTIGFDKANNKPFNVTFFASTNSSAETNDINPLIVVKDSKGNIISKNSNGSYTVPIGETKLKVEVQTQDDNNFEGNEVFELNGKTEFMSSNVSGNGTILDDDRVLTVSDVTVNEGSPYAVFEVSGSANQLASLSLANQNTDGSNLSTLQYFNGTTWTNYSSGNVSLDSNGKLLVRVALNPEQENRKSVV